MKPEPPPDLWEQLEAELGESQRPLEPPPDAFTIHDFAKRFSLTAGQAQNRLRKLQLSGAVVKLGRYARQQVYYRLAKK